MRLDDTRKNSRIRTLEEKRFFMLVLRQKNTL
jgi:hypothetical protein